MIVLDNSALIEYLVGDNAVGRRVRLTLRGQEIAVPCSVDLECLSVLRKLVRHGELAKDRADAAFDLFARLSLQRHDHAPLLGRVWELRDNMTPYDAVYAALAERLESSLVTVDRKFEKTPGLKCQVLNLRDE